MPRLVLGLTFLLATAVGALAQTSLVYTGTFASGDEYLEDEHFKQRALHPDYNVGLILFEEFCDENPGAC